MSQDPNPFAAPQETDFAAPGKAWAQIASPELRRVGMGLSCVYYGIVLLLLVVLAAGAGGALTGGPAGINIWFFQYVMLATLGAYLLTILGPLLCLAVPVRSGAKQFVVVSVALQLPGAAAMAGRLFGIASPSGGANVAIWMATLLGWLFFLVFLRKLSTFIGQPHHASRAATLLVGSCTLIAAALFGATVLDKANLGGTSDSRFMWRTVSYLGLIGAGLVVFVSYANLINALRKQLRP